MIIIFIIGALIGLFVGFRFGRWAAVAGMGRAEIRSVRRKLKEH